MDTTMLRNHLRIASALASIWFDPRNRPNHHGLRRSRVSAAWPELARTLDALVESQPSQDDAAAVEQPVVRGRCPVCDAAALSLTVNPDPRTAQPVHRVDPCAHVVAPADAMALYEAGVAVKSMVPADGAALIRAEGHRVRAEGRTPEGDALQESGQLAWAAWCVLDRMGHPEADGVPAMWPYEPERWKPERTPLRSLIVAGSLIAHEIDRRLERGERPDRWGTLTGMDSQSPRDDAPIVPDDTQQSDDYNPVDENVTTADPVDDDVADETKAWPPGDIETK